MGVRGRLFSTPRTASEARGLKLRPEAGRGLEEQRRKERCLRAGPGGGWGWGGRGAVQGEAPWAPSGSLHRILGAVGPQRKGMGAGRDPRNIVDRSKPFARAAREMGLLWRTEVYKPA